MPAIAIKGVNKTYLFSVIEVDYDNLPEWGGVYIAVNASGFGLRMEDCVALGSCSNFKKWQHKIKQMAKHYGATYLYLLPEFEASRRSIAIEDLTQTEAFKNLHFSNNHTKKENETGDYTLVKSA